VFENRALRRIFGPKRDEVTGDWRKLYNEELLNLFSSPDIIRQIKSRRMRLAGHVARMGEDRKLYKVLVGKPEGKRPLGRPRCRWEDGIRMDLREIGFGCVDWIRLAQDRDRWRAVVSAVMNLRVLAPRSLFLLYLAKNTNLKLFLDQFLSVSSYFPCLVAKYSPQLSVLKHPQSSSLLVNVRDQVSQPHKTKVKL
jgi:hypothetical protein